VDSLINRLGQKGIYTLVDGHQDILARRICGEGIPNFYAVDANLSHSCSQGFLPYFSQYAPALCKSMKDYGFRYDKEGNPLVEDCQKNFFPQYYLSPESMSLFERLYFNSSNLQDSFIAFWKAVADRLSRNPFALGFDPLNEPFPSNMYTEPALVYEPGLFDREKLQPLYKRVFDEAFQSQSIMFFEPAQFPDFFGTMGGIVFNLGFTEAPGGSDKANLHVLNDHTYCCELSADMCTGNGGEPPLEKAKECRNWHQKRVTTRLEDAERYKTPLFISEFGACKGSESCIQEITSVTEVCDEHLVGWAYWQFKNFNDITTTAGNGSEGFYNVDGSL
jgi:endoglycosylceramidase